MKTLCEQKRASADTRHECVLNFININIYIIMINSDFEVV